MGRTHTISRSPVGKRANNWRFKGEIPPAQGSIGWCFTCGYAVPIGSGWVLRVIDAASQLVHNPTPGCGIYRDGTNRQPHRSAGFSRPKLTPDKSRQIQCN